MFTPTLSSKQKHMKTTQKQETENAVRGSSRENFIFHPKTQISYTQIPNLLETQPRIILQPEHRLSMNSTDFLHS